MGYCSPLVNPGDRLVQLETDCNVLGIIIVLVGTALKVPDLQSLRGEIMKRRAEAEAGGARDKVSRGGGGEVCRPILFCGQK